MEEVKVKQETNSIGEIVRTDESNLEEDVAVSRIDLFYPRPTPFDWLGSISPKPKPTPYNSMLNKILTVFIIAIQLAN